MHNRDFTPQLDDPEALYLITFMPHIARRLTRRILVGNFMAAKIEKTLAEVPDDDSALMLEAYKDKVATDILSGQHWSEKYSIVMGPQSALRLPTLSGFLV